MSDQPVGSDFEEIQPPDRRPFLSRRELLIVVAVVVWLFSILVPNFLKARARGQLTACKSNLKNIATALEMYAEDNKGHYPERLDLLIPGNYLKQIPTCPSRSRWSRAQSPGEDYTYEMQAKPAAFSMCCRGDHANAYTGFNADPHGFPQYQSENGLIDHP